MIVVIPMAGKGSRFSECGYLDPKPLIEIKQGIRMIEAVVTSIGIPDASYVFICHSDHKKYDLEKLFNSMNLASFQIVWVNHITEGAACSVLQARDIINTSEPIMIVNSDQILEWSSDHFIKYVNLNSADSAILTFTISGEDQKWSFVKLSEDYRYISEVKEKRQISNIATAGLYYFSRGEIFVKSAEAMISENDRYNGEFYVAPVYNYVIEQGYTVMNYPIPTIYATGTPDDLNKYIGTRHWQCL